MPMFFGADRNWPADTRLVDKAFLRVVVISIMLTYGALSARSQLTSFKPYAVRRGVAHVSALYRCLSLRERNLGMPVIVLGDPLSIPPKHIRESLAQVSWRET